MARDRRWEYLFTVPFYYTHLYMICTIIEGSGEELLKRHSSAGRTSCGRRPPSLLLACVVVVNVDADHFPGVLPLGRHEVEVGLQFAVRPVSVVSLVLGRGMGRTRQGVSAPLGGHAQVVRGPRPLQGPRVPVAVGRVRRRSLRRRSGRRAGPRRHRDLALAALSPGHLLLRLVRLERIIGVRSRVILPRGVGYQLLLQHKWYG